MATIRETKTLLPCAGCTDPANHPHAFDCPGNTPDSNYDWDNFSGEIPDDQLPYGAETARVISNRDGGIVAYVHTANADAFVTALNRSYNA